MFRLIFTVWSCLAENRCSHLVTTKLTYRRLQYGCYPQTSLLEQSVLSVVLVVSWKFYELDLFISAPTAIDFMLFNLICQSTQSKFRKQIKTSVTSNSSSQWYLPTTFHPNCFLQQLFQNKTSDTNNRISHALHQRVISRNKSRKSIMPKKPSNLPNNSKNRSYRVYSHQWTKWKNRAKSAILVNQLYQDWIII